nr:unnamed protein product [Callosobruchus analis]CAI5857167.1 unnamed protein product [Callosobruchus analis]
MVITRDIRDEIKNSVSSSINSMLKDDEFVNLLVQKVTNSITKTLEARFVELEQKVESYSSVVKELKEETGLLRYENESLLQKLDDIDQAHRANNLRLFQVKENAQENTVEKVINILNSHLGITVKNNDLLSCTRTGKQVNNRTRGILLKLASSSMKLEIYKKKKLLKGTGVVIKEDLTDNRLKLMDAAIEKTSFRNVWSYNGSIYALKGGKRVAIRNKGDVDNL